METLHDRRGVGTRLLGPVVADLRVGAGRSTPGGRGGPPPRVVGRTRRRRSGALRVGREARLAVLALLVLAGCSALRAAPPARTYRVDYPPPPPASGPGSGVLRIAPFGIAALYDREGFVYRDGRYDIAVDSYHRWLAPPAGMVTNLLARDLAASKQFAAVLTSPSALPSTYELMGVLDELEERPDGGCTAHVSLRAVLVQVTAEGKRSILFDQTFAADAPCAGDDPDSFAAAMSHAVERVSNDLIAAIAAARRAQS